MCWVYAENVCKSSGGEGRVIIDIVMIEIRKNQ